VRGLAGNAQDGCLGLFNPPSRALRIARGEAWDIGGRNVRATARFRLGPSGRDPSLGFRGVFRPVEALVV
jgi:formylglycine-generating enzyme required for sulfatase activity